MSSPSAPPEIADSLPTPAKTPLAEIRRLARAGRFAEAHKALAAHPVEGRSKGTAEFAWRLEEVAGFFPRLDASWGAGARFALSGSEDFLSGRDEPAVLRLAQAASLDPGNGALAEFLARVEHHAGLRAERVPAGGGSLLELKLKRSEAAFLKNSLSEVIWLCEEILVLDARNPTALVRLGSALHLSGRNAEARSVLQKALLGETRDAEVMNLRFMLAQVEKKIAEKAGGKR